MRPIPTDSLNQTHNARMSCIGPLGKRCTSENTVKILFGGIPVPYSHVEHMAGVEKDANKDRRGETEIGRQCSNEREVKRDKTNIIYSYSAPLLTIDASTIMALMRRSFRPKRPIPVFLTGIDKTGKRHFVVIFQDRVYTAWWYTQHKNRVKLVH